VAPYLPHGGGLRGCSLFWCPDRGCCVNRLVSQLVDDYAALHNSGCESWKVRAGGSELFRAWQVSVTDYRTEEPASPPQSGERIRRRRTWRKPSRRSSGSRCWGRRAALRQSCGSWFPLPAPPGGMPAPHTPRSACATPLVPDAHRTGRRPGARSGDRGCSQPPRRPRQPCVLSGDSTVTISRGFSAWTLTTRSPGSPTSRSQRSQ